MRLKPDHPFRNTAAWLMAVLFLNMSFFMTELSYLDVKKKDKAMFERLVKLVSGVSEEERDAGDESGESLSGAREVDLVLQARTEITPLYFTLIPKPRVTHTTPTLLSGILQTITQPPEAAS